MFILILLKCWIADVTFPNGATCRKLKGERGFSLIPLADMGACEVVFRYVFFCVCVYVCECVRSGPRSKKEKEYHGLCQMSKNIFQL